MSKKNDWLLCLFIVVVVALLLLLSYNIKMAAVHAATMKNYILIYIHFLLLLQKKKIDKNKIIFIIYNE